MILAVLMEWPSLRYASTTVPKDLIDPLTQAYLLSWPGHIWPIDPAQLWNTNTFFPELDSFAFSDSMLGYAPFSFFGHGTQAALIRINLLFVGVRALSFIGAYALVRQLGSSWPGALLAGVAFAFAPWTYSHSNHLNILSTGGIALAMAALCRGHGFSFSKGFEHDKVRPGWALTGWLIAAWQISIGFALGLPFFYVLLSLCSLAGAAAIFSWIKHRRSPLPNRLLLADGLGGMIFGLITWYMVTPSLRLIEHFPETKRSLGEIAYFSPHWQSFFIAPANSRFWGDVHAPLREHLVAGRGAAIDEVTLFPGIILLACALLGVLFSIWRIWVRIALLVAICSSAVLAQGPWSAGGRYSYLALYNHLPGWDAIRTPGRLMLWIILALAVLAAGFVSRVGKSLGKNPRKKFIAAVLVIPALLVGLEGTSTTPHPKVPAAPIAVQHAKGPMLVLPSSYPFNPRVMFWTVGIYTPTVNGSNALLPPSQGSIVAHALQIPDAASVSYLRNQGIRSVVVLRDEALDDSARRLLGVQARQLPATVTRIQTPDAVTFVLKPV
ncbi:MAG: hypothetical protein DLM55_02485 [Acidimicrobiales bacterium]|nr:MAG: hypothetical protein DLM55_02485 [Acidimicrobiales bacterium]